MHDHSEQAVTNKGISPGGDVTTIAYEGHIDADGLPVVATSLNRFFDPDYYAGKVPVFDPSIFHSTPADYEKGWGDGAGGTHHNELEPEDSPARRTSDLAHEDDRGVPECAFRRKAASDSDPKRPVIPI